MSKKWKIVGVVAGLVIILCSLFVLNVLRTIHVPDYELPGKYVGMHGKGEDIIELRSDSSYLHLYREKSDDEFIVNEGTWERESSEGITLAEFRDFTNLFGDFQEPHFETLAAYKSFFGNTVRLGGSEVYPNYYFEKVD